MSSGGALPKHKSSRGSLRDPPQRDDDHLQNSNSEIFELAPKPKLFCIPENCSRYFNDLRRTQSMSVTQNYEQPEKSWSVLYVGSKSDRHNKHFY